MISNISEEANASPDKVLCNKQQQEYAKTSEFFGGLSSMIDKISK